MSKLNYTQSKPASRTEGLRERIAQMREETETLKELWVFSFPDIEMPKDSQFHLWMRRHGDIQTLIDGFETAADWFIKAQSVAEETGTEPKLIGDVLRYVSGVMIGMDQDIAEAAKRKSA